MKYNIFIGFSLGLMIGCFLASYALGFWYGKKMIMEDGYTAKDVVSTFFCIIMGGGALGQAGPILKNIAAGKSAIGKISELMKRVPTLIEPKNGVAINKIDSI